MTEQFWSTDLIKERRKNKLTKQTNTNKVK
jgi:hypothetical protein